MEKVIRVTSTLWLRSGIYKTLGLLAMSDFLDSLVLHGWAVYNELSNKPSMLYVNSEQY